MSDKENQDRDYGKEEFAFSLGKTWGSLRLLQMYYPDNPLSSQLELIIKNLEDDMSILVYKMVPRPSEHS